MKDYNVNINNNNKQIILDILNNIPVSVISNKYNISVSSINNFKNKLLKQDIQSVIDDNIKSSVNNCISDIEQIITDCKQLFTVVKDDLQDADTLQAKSSVHKIIQGYIDKLLRAEEILAKISGLMQSDTNNITINNQYDIKILDVVVDTVNDVLADYPEIQDKFMHALMGKQFI